MTLHLTPSAKKPLSSRQHFSLTAQVSFPLWLSSPDFLKTFSITDMKPKLMSIKIGLQGRTAASKSSLVLQLKIKAGLQEHPNTNSTTRNYKNLHHSEQAVLWHKNGLNWVSLQFPTHTSSGDQWSGTSHPTTAAPAPQNRPCSNRVCT